MIREDGAVSALCFKRPRKIDLTRSSWTIRDEAVTCSKCLALLAKRETAEAWAWSGKAFD